MMNQLKTKQRYPTELAVRYDDELATVELTTAVAFEITYQTSHNSTKTMLVTPINTQVLQSERLLGFCPLDLEAPFWISREKLLSIQNPLRVWVIKGQWEDVLFAAPRYIESVTLDANAKTTPATAHQGNAVPRFEY